VSVMGMTLSTTTATVEACGGGDSPFANRFNGSSLDATSPAIVRKAINFARQHRLAPSQCLTIFLSQQSSANDTLELRRTLEMFGLVGSHAHCVQRIAPSMGGPGKGLLAGRAELNRLVGWLEEEWNKPVEDIQCTFTCSLAAAYDRAAFLASIPAPEAEKGWVLLLKKGEQVVGGASPKGLKTDTEWLRAASPNGPRIDCYERSSQEPIPFLFKLTDAHHPDTVAKKTGDTSAVAAGSRLLSLCIMAGVDISHALWVELASPFHHGARILTSKEAERPLMSGPARVEGGFHTVCGGWDVVEVWQGAYMGQRAMG